MNIRHITSCLLAAASSFLLSSCGSSYYNRSASKAGMCEDGGSSFFNPLQGLVSINTGIYNNGGYRGGFCPPQRPQYGGYYPQPRPQQCGTGYGYRPPQPQYRPQPCPPGYGGGGYPQRRTQGSHYSNPIRSGQIEFSDSNPGGVWRR